MHPGRSVLHEDRVVVSHPVCGADRVVVSHPVCGADVPVCKCL